MTDAAIDADLSCDWIIKEKISELSLLYMYFLTVAVYC